MSLSLTPIKKSSAASLDKKLSTNELKESHELLLTVRIQNASHTVLWKTEQPLPIGHPFRYVLEKTKEGFRLRNLRSSSLSWNKVLVQNLAFSDVVSSHGILEFSSPTPLVIKVQLPQKFVAPFHPSENKSTGSELHVYSCKGDWAQEATLFHETYNGVLRGEEVFQLTKKSGSEFWLKTKNPELQIQTKNSSHPAREGAIQFKDLLNSTLILGKHTWHFAAVPTPHFNARVGKALPTDKDSETLKKSLIGVFGFLFVTFVIGMLWPKSKQEELIPEQFTKIVMKAPTKPVSEKPKTQETAQLMEGGQQKPVSEKVKNTAVSQAFRSQALQNAVSGLLKGGMTSLMASQNLAQSGRSTGEIAKYFNEKADAMKGSLVAGSGQGVPTASKVGMVGGGSGGGKAGYAEGANAKVAGQGGNFVALDTSGSFVEEGLTKDEVGEVIHKHMSEIRYCYESTMTYTPDLEGKLLLAFTINPQGRVSTTSVKSSTVPDPRLDDCVIRRLMTWKFPNPKGGINVEVTYPFLFKTLGR